MKEKITKVCALKKNRNRYITTIQSENKTVIAPPITSVLAFENYLIVFSPNEALLHKRYNNLVKTEGKNKSTSDNRKL